MADKKLTECGETTSTGFSHVIGAKNNTVYRIPKEELIKAAFGGGGYLC